MNAFLGGLLTKKLVQQMETRDKLRARTKSFASQDSLGLSSESFESDDGDDVPRFDDFDDSTPFGIPPV